MNRPRFARPFPRLAALPLAAALCLTGCSTVENFLGGDKVDYRSGATKTAALDVPPDLTQLARESRFQVQGGSVSASGQAVATAAPVAAAAAVVAPATLGAMKIERDGNQRWLNVPLPADRLWPQLRGFWQELGFNLVTDSPEAGVMETSWAENRAKIPMDFVRSALGRLFDSLYSSSERDRFRLRVERNGAGSDVFITHRGMEEVYVGALKENTTWRPRANDPQLEAEMLTRLMVKLGGREDTPRTQVAATGAATPAAAAPVARARVLSGRPAASLQVDENFDRAWRRVGLALDRSGFTVEDRDRAAGVYFVRYVDPKSAGKEDPSIFQRLFGRSDTDNSPVKYRVSVKAEADKSVVAVLNSQGAAEAGEHGQRIVEILLSELK